MKKVFLLILAFAFVLAGCSRMTDTFKTFSTQGLEDFFGFYATTDTKESLIREGKIEFARIGDFYVCPFIKEVNYDECALFFYVYALEDCNAETITVSNIVLSTDDNIDIINKNDDGLAIALSATGENIQLGVSSIKFKATDTWLFNGNTLHLSFKAMVDNANVDRMNFSYNIDIIGNKSVVTIT